MLENKFYKVNMTGGSYVTSLFFNPVTKETRTEVARDYDYYDGSRDNDKIYYMPIDEEAAESYRRYMNSINGGSLKVGDLVEVVKGRKIPKGTVAKVVRLFIYYDVYRRPVQHYAVFEDGRKTSEYNCKII